MLPCGHLGPWVDGECSVCLGLQADLDTAETAHDAAIAAHDAAPTTDTLHALAVTARALADAHNACART